MDDTPAYLEKLRRDLLEQFKDKPNIEVLQEALAKELEEVHKFFDELNTLRWLQTAEGVQLDGIGDIVVMSRAEALVVSRMAGVNIPMDDDNYRLYLTFKIHLNTNECTYSDVFRALKMFWARTPLYYSEDPNQPATIIITIPERISAIEWNVLQIATMVKAAGVGLHYILHAEFNHTDYAVCGVSEVIREYFIREETEIGDVIDVWDYSAVAVSEYIGEEYRSDD